MKSFSRKAGIYTALVIALLITLVLVISCDGLFGNLGKKEKAEIPEGYGVLSFGDSNERTIMPTAPTGGEYLLVFTHTAGSSGTGTVERYMNSLTGSVLLPAGIYTLEVYATNTTGATGTIADAYATGDYVGAAVGTGATSTGEIGIAPGVTTTPIAVTLEPYDPDGSGEGTFAFVITNSLSLAYTLAASSVVVTPMASGSVVTFPFTAAALSDDDDFDSGYYWVDLIVNTTNGGQHVYRDIAHIYQNMTSTFEYEIVDKYIIVLGGTAGGIALSYTHPTDGASVLSVVGSSLASVNGTTAQSGDGSSGNPFLLSLSTGEPDRVEITVSGAGANAYSWSHGSTTLGAATTALVANVSTAPFNAVGSYAISLFVTISGVQYAVSPGIHITVQL